MNELKAPAPLVPLEEIVFPRNEKKAKTLLQALNGKRVIVLGNHPDAEDDSGIYGDRDIMVGNLQEVYRLKFRINTGPPHGSFDFKYDKKSPTRLSKTFDGKVCDYVRLYK